MTTLSQKAIDELKAIHKKQTGKELSDKAASAMGNRLLRIFAILISEPRSASDASSRTDHPAIEADDASVS